VGKLRRFLGAEKNANSGSAKPQQAIAEQRTKMIEKPQTKEGDCEVDAFSPVSSQRPPFIERLEKIKDLFGSTNSSSTRVMISFSAASGEAAVGARPQFGQVRRGVAVGVGVPVK